MKVEVTIFIEEGDQIEERPEELHPALSYSASRKIVEKTEKNVLNATLTCLMAILEDFAEKDILRK